MITEKQYKEISEKCLVIEQNVFGPTFDYHSFSNMLDVAHKEYLIIQKKESIIRRYDKETADKIFAHKYWIGMSEIQLVESLGEPSKVKREETLTETKIRYCYGTSLEFTIENDKVAKIVEK